MSVSEAGIESILRGIRHPTAGVVNTAVIEAAEGRICKSMRNPRGETGAKCS